MENGIHPIVQKMAKRKNQRQGLANVQDSKQYRRQRIFGNLQSTVSRKAQRRIRSDVTCINKGSKSTTSGCSILNSEGQKQQKFESQKSIGRERPINLFGHSAVSYVIGNSHPKKSEPAKDRRSISRKKQLDCTRAALPKTNSQLLR